MVNLFLFPLVSILDDIFCLKKHKFFGLFEDRDRLIMYSWSNGKQVHTVCNAFTTVVGHYTYIFHFRLPIFMAQPMMNTANQGIAGTSLENTYMGCAINVVYVYYVHVL